MNSIALKEKAVEIICKNILTPVIYMLNTGGNICFICFLDDQIPVKRIYMAEQSLTALFGSHCEITDIRDFPVCDRVTVISKAELIYCEDNKTQSILELHMMSDLAGMLAAKSELTDRLNNCDSMYMN